MFRTYQNFSTTSQKFLRTYYNPIIRNFYRTYHNFFLTFENFLPYPKFCQKYLNFSEIQIYFLKLTFSCPWNYLNLREFIWKSSANLPEFTWKSTWNCSWATIRGGGVLHPPYPTLATALIVKHNSSQYIALPWLGRG